MVKAKRSSMKVLRNLYVMALAGMWATLYGVYGQRIRCSVMRSGGRKLYLEAVVDVQAWHHHQEAVRVDASHEGGDHEAVPALVRVVEDAVDGVRAE